MKGRWFNREITNIETACLDLLHSKYWWLWIQACYIKEWMYQTNLTRPRDKGKFKNDFVLNPAVPTDINYTKALLFNIC